MMNNWSLPVFSTDDKSLFAENREALWEESEILPKEQANCPRSSPILMFDQPHTLPLPLKDTGVIRRLQPSLMSFLYGVGAIPRNTVYTNRSQIALVRIVSLVD